MMRAFRALIICLVAMTSLATASAAHETSGESVVLVGQNASQLLGINIAPASVIVRSTYLSGGTIYELGRDYAIDAVKGTISRSPNSRIPDFADNILFGKKDFDHSRFPGYGNGKFFVYVDYECETARALTKPRNVAAQLGKTAARLRAGEPVKLIAFGDSITAGGDASSVELQYPSLYATRLRKRFPRARITLENGATGGDSTVQGLARLEEKVLSRKPDLVLIAFGMNDHNVNGVPPADFKANLEQIVAQIRVRTGADVILLSTFPPHPDWHFGSHRMDQYAKATEEAAKESDVPYADVFALWQIVLQRKDPSSLLGNNINHPNDFGHWLYLHALDALRF